MMWDSMVPLWSDAEAPKPDTYVAFRGGFDLQKECDLTIRVLGVTWFNLWLDGEFLTEGPARFHHDKPSYETIQVSLPKGRHVLAAEVHYLGVVTRILKDIRPFWACDINKDEMGNTNEAIAVEWRSLALAGYKPQVRRINPQLGWVEWCDTQQLPHGWRDLHFDDSDWLKPVQVEPAIGIPRPLDIDSVRSVARNGKIIAQGNLAETFGYERDDIPARFYLRDLVCDDLPAQGIWRRYDLGRVCLMRPRFILDLPRGTVVEFAYSESLSSGRVSPYITLSAGQSCNLDHYVARGGVQEFFPLEPRGGRFVEIHVFAEPSKIKFVQETFIERCYYGELQGSFDCGDPLLGKIWLTGIETLRGCCEDAVIDNPTRERGQWTGDVSTVAMDIASVGFSDLRLCRRALVHSALCAREDGLVAGLCPGGEAYLSSYAALWVTGCLRYWELTGDLSLLEELFPYAERNSKAFERFMTDQGVVDGLGWNFVDWGYVRNAGESDMALNLYYLSAIRGMIRWCKALGQGDRLEHYTALEARITVILNDWFVENLKDPNKGWRAIGYHRAVFGLQMGFFDDLYEGDCVRYLQEHLRNCFPNNPQAPRNSDPTKTNTQLITPYYAFYAFPLLIERGEMDFVLEQYKQCWGWALEDGRTTWIEVFDTRWSHCHQWAGCPTAQLSRYVLGLHTRYDLGPYHFILSLKPGSLKQAKGKLPMPGAEERGCIQIEWEKQPDGIHYRLKTPTPIILHIPDVNDPATHEMVDVSGELQIVLPDL